MAAKRKMVYVQNPDSEAPDAYALGYAARLLLTSTSPLSHKPRYSVTWHIYHDSELLCAKI